MPHGVANAVLLPYVIKYNATKPTKFATFPKYEYFVADEKYAKAARFVGLAGNTTEESVDNLIKAIRQLMRDLNMPMSIRECGVDEDVFMSGLRKLAENAHDDQCTGANPRYPLVEEIMELYKQAYYGEEN